MEPTTDARAGAADDRPRSRGRGRRPTAEVRREVLLAAGRLLLESGMAAFTIEEVARRSGASKMTIYKFWPSRGALALEGYFTTVEDDLRFPDTGDVRADLRSQLHAFVHLLVDSPAGRVVSELVGAAQTDAQLRSAYVASYSSPRRELAVQRIAAAQRSGQLRAGIDPYVLVDQLWGACYHRLLVPDLPIDTAFVDTLLDHLFVGVLAQE
jgi:AcrR family transcriptional regulator